MERFSYRVGVVYVNVHFITKVFKRTGLGYSTIGYVCSLIFRGFW